MTGFLDDLQNFLKAAREACQFELSRLRSQLAQSWRILTLTGAIVLLGVVAIDPPPPKKIRVASGAIGTAQDKMARRLKDALATSGVDLELIATRGSADSAAMVSAHTNTADLAFVQSIALVQDNLKDVVSLGSLGYEPAWLFYRTDTSGKAYQDLSDLVAKRVGIGGPGSATNLLALKLLSLSNLRDSPNFISMPTSEAVEKLKQGQLDAVFLVDGPDSDFVQELAAISQVRLANFTRADAYLQFLPELEKVNIPEGSLNILFNTPHTAIQTLASTTDMIARDELHPALQYLLLETAKKLYSSETLLTRRGEFPAFKPSNMDESKIATQFYTDGSPFITKYLPFWAAELISRLAISVLPIILAIYPLFKNFSSYRTKRANARINALYQQLKFLENKLDAVRASPIPSAIILELAAIEKQAIELTVPSSVASDYYSLRSAIDLVKSSLAEMPETQVAAELS